MLNRRALLARTFGLVVAAALPLGATYAAAKAVTAAPEPQSAWLVSWGEGGVYGVYPKEVGVDLARPGTDNVYDRLSTR
jgi:hypothetical protein